MSTTTIPTEESLRSARFRFGQAITLEDGQDWHFPTPRVLFRPSFATGRVSESTPATDLGDDFNHALDALESSENDNRSFLSRMFELAAIMMRYNYNITDDQLTELFAFRPGDEASQDTWRSIMGVARGNDFFGPGTDTSESAS